MATWVIGDIHGCWDALERLLAAIAFDPGRDRLVLVGDLVNRGPQSLAVLRWAYQHRDSVRAVLGNHDLHLLARWVHAAAEKPEDTLAEILAAPDREALLDWLRHQPLLVEEAGWWVVHAGLHPAWSAVRARSEAARVGAVLSGDGVAAFLVALYDESPSCRSWCSDVDDGGLAAAAVFTRLRMVDGDGEPRLKYTGAPAARLDRGWVPWFEVSPVVASGQRVAFGHWAQLGLFRAGSAVCLDSSCVYGGRLSALNLANGAVIAV